AAASSSSAAGLGGSGAGSGAGSLAGTGGGGGAGAGGSGGSATPFCASNPGHFFCADFDEGQLVAGWSSVDQTGTRSSTGLDTMVAESPPGSFRVTVEEPGDASSCLSSRLVKELPGTTTGVHVDMDLRGCDKDVGQDAGMHWLSINCTLETADGGPGKTYGILNFGVQGASGGVELWGDAGGTPAQSWNQTFQKPSAAKFSHVHVDLTIGAQGSAEVTIDGVSVLSKTNVDVSCPSTRQRALAMGMFTCSELPDCSIWFDDVLVDVDP
ncbi:MAG TPA: hypothetical protein VHB21_00160, partial [Minicystis sp.]|nr:hypothetical protein [Minicystis sp.]